MIRFNVEYNEQNIGKPGDDFCSMKCIKRQVGCDSIPPKLIANSISHQVLYHNTSNIFQSFNPYLSIKQPGLDVPDAQ